jgi:nicotinate-nucleotide adenylyltransferase
MVDPRGAPAPAGGAGASLSRGVRPAGVGDRRAPADGTRSAGLGILGGTFNPPHLAHLELARHALRELELERVLLMPAFRSPFKPVEEDPGPEHRLRMCRLAAAEAEGVSACALEVERGGPSYTVDTLRALHAAHPDSRLTLVLGADVARTLTAWREPRELLELAELAVALRAGSEPEAIRAALAPLLCAGQAPRHGLRFLEMPVIDVSSSLVRERIRRGLAVADLVGPAVGAYSAAHGLYRAAATGAQGRS